MDSGISKYGLYNVKLNKWVVKPAYQQVLMLGASSGVYYYAIYDRGAYGIMNELGEWTCPLNLQDYRHFKTEGLLCVKQGGSWGIVDLYGRQIVPCTYKQAYMDGTDVTLIKWDDTVEKSSQGALLRKRDRLIKEENLEAERKAAEEKARFDRERLEKELSSFTEYARAFVEPRINEWQKKGEFEKLADYQRRVTGPNRTAMIDSLTLEAECKFKADYASLKHEEAPMRLDVYDSENEVFFIESEKLGKMVVPVPISDGPAFKARFASIEKRNPVFYIENDKIALASLDFYDPQSGKTYRYNNNNALSYNHYDIDPDAYKFDLVSVVTAKPASPASATTPPRRPTVTILSPRSNGTYSEETVEIRYKATVYDGKAPVVHVWINGMEVQAEPKLQMQEKGAGAGYDAIDLTLPKDRNRPCNIMLSVSDGSGYSSENKTVSLQYVGETPKPSLHLFAVGVSNYKSASLTKLGYAAKDAEDFIGAVSASDLSMYGKIGSSTLLTDAKATKSNIEKGIVSLLRNAQQDDVIMLYLSGHGVSEGGDTYFMSVDASADEPYTGVDFAFIRKNMLKMTDKKCRVLIFMDACYSGAMFAAKSELKNLTFAEPDIIGFYSSSASQTSAEMKAAANGLFTKALLEGLGGKARNKDGEITTVSLQKFVSDYVSEQSRGKQTPIVENKIGDIVLYKAK